MSRHDRRAIRVLLVEDSPTDAMLVAEGLQSGPVDVELHVVTDGEQAIEYLSGCGQAGTPRPDLVLLDLHLPAKDGVEVLAEVKADPDLQTIPVIVLTGSVAEEDVLRCYRLHANSYVQKPSDIERFEALVQQVQGYWLQTVRRPV